MNKKSRLVILDADVIITCYQEGIWNQLVNHYDVQIPEAVAHEEVKYFRSPLTGQKEDINLQAQFKTQKIALVSATLEDIVSLKLIASTHFFQAIDDGEMEAIAYLHARPSLGLKFCTGDQTAIVAASALGLGSNLVSLEELCKEAQISVDLRPSFSEEACKDKVAKGVRERGFFLSNSE